MQQASEDEFNRALNIAFDNRLGDVYKRQVSELINSQSQGRSHPPLPLLTKLGQRINDVNQGDAGVSPLPLPDFRRCNHRRQWDIPLFNGEFFHQLTIMRITHRLRFIVLPVL